MNREELKRILIEKGVDPRLTQMPAIVEPLFEKFNFVSSIVVRNSNLVENIGDGNYKIDGRTIKINNDGTAKIITGDGNDTIDVNQAGIETIYSSSDDLFTATSIVRKEGFIDHAFMNDGNGSCRVSRYFDNGHWSIKKAYGDPLKEKDGMPYEFDEKKVIEIFKETSREISRIYPNTTEWYQKKERELEERIAAEKDPLRKKKNIVSALQTRERILKRSVKGYTQRVEGKLKELGLSLDFVEAIKTHPYGKEIFADLLAEYQERTMFFASPYEEERAVEVALKEEYQRRAKSDTGIAHQNKEPRSQQDLESEEGLEQEEKRLLDLIRVLELEEKSLSLRAERLDFMEEYTGKFIRAIQDSPLRKKAFVAKALLNYRLKKMAAKVQPDSKEREFE